MGTYTANYQLYMPTVGEQGWGDLMNGNLTTIDTTMKSLSNSIGTLETETDAMKEKLDGIADGTYKGTYFGKLYINGVTSTTETSNAMVYANPPAVQTLTVQPGAYSSATSNTITCNGYSKIEPSYPLKVSPGVYIPSEDYIIDNMPSIVTRVATLSVWKANVSNGDTNYIYGRLYVDGKHVFTVSNNTPNGTQTGTYNIPCESSVYIVGVNDVGAKGKVTLSIASLPTYYLSDE